MGPFADVFQNTRFNIEQQTSLGRRAICLAAGAFVKALQLAGLQQIGSILPKAPKHAIQRKLRLFASEM